MKRVKIMLSAILVFAVVGGLFAFRTKTDSFCLYQKNTGNTCTLIVEPLSTSDIGAGNQTVITRPATGCASTTLSTNCSRKFDFTID